MYNYQGFMPLNDAPTQTVKAAPSLNNPTGTKLEKTTYPFVDLIRFIATFGIVFIHTDMPSDKYNFNDLLHHVNHAAYYFLFRQLFKFSTICYFLIAGFLLADRAIDNNPFEYYKRRMNVIAKPYLLALLLFVAGSVIVNFFTAHTFNPHYLLMVTRYTLLYTPFWYIPNYFICLLVIVCFSRYVNSVYFGAGLFLITMGYTYYMVYSHNYNSSHTTALFGFVFYMWLGVYIKKNDLVTRIKKINPYLLGLLLLVAYAMGNAETYYLFNYTQTHDASNTLRISNQLYSVLVFIFLIRCCNSVPRFGFFKPRQETYGIYLYHCFFIFFIIPALENQVSHYFNISFFSFNIYKLIGVILLNFTLSYLGTTLLVKLLLRFKLAYLPLQG